MSIHPPVPLGRGAGLPDASRVTLANWQIGPWNRWAFQHVGNLVTSAQISRGDGPVAVLPRSPRDLAGVAFTAVDGSKTTLAQLIDATYTDGIVVLKDGIVQFERYLNGMVPGTKHLLMSVSKSLTGLLAGILEGQGRLDVDAPVPIYVPELAESAYGDATVQQVLDMQVSVVFSEDYEDPISEVQMQDRVAGWRPRLPDDPADGFAMLPGLRKADGTGHGRVFQYCSATTDVLGWILERAGGAPFADLMGRELWGALGMEHDACITVDAGDFPFANGGICVTLRDLARIGQMTLDDGWSNGRQIVPGSWIDDTRFGGDNAAWLRSDTSAKDAFPHGAYRNKWWIANDDHGSFYATGIHGQHLWIDPATRVVIAKLSTHPAPVDRALFDDTLQAFAAVSREL